VPITFLKRAISSAELRFTIRLRHNSQFQAKVSLRETFAWNTIHNSLFIIHFSLVYRYYFAAKLGHGVDDVDLNRDDFFYRVNADLIGKFVNIASRCAKFITICELGQEKWRLLQCQCVSPNK